MKNQVKYQEIVLVFLRLVVAAIFFQAAYAKFGFWSGTPEGMSSGTALLMKFLSVVETLGAIAVLVLVSYALCRRRTGNNHDRRDFRNAVCDGCWLCHAAGSWLELSPACSRRLSCAYTFRRRAVFA